MAQRSADAYVSIPVYGNGAYYAERAAHARRHPATQDVRIAEALFLCPEEGLLDVDAPLAEQSEAGRRLAYAHLAQIRTQMLAGRVGGPVGEALMNDALAIATGWHLLRAIHGVCHGDAVSQAGTETLDNFLPRVAVTRAVRETLLAGGIRAIRFIERDRGLNGEMLGLFYCVLDQQVLRRPDATTHDLLCFECYPSADASAVARGLNQAWLTLDDDLRPAVRAAVGACRRSHRRTAQATAHGEAYAYPHPGGGIAWGVDGRPGVAVRGVQRLPADQPLSIESAAQLHDIAQSWHRLGDLVGAMKEPARAKDLLAAAGWHRRAAEDWLAVGMTNAAALVKGQAELRLITDRWERLTVAIGDASNDPIWRSGFDAAGWVHPPRQAAALTLQDFLAELFVAASALAEQGRWTQQECGR